MKISEKDVSYVADLANLELKEAERGSMLRDLNSILDHIDMLNEIDSSNVEPVAQVADGFRMQSENKSDSSVSTGRDDILEGLRKSLSQEAALENAPDTDGTFFLVPKVIER